MVDIMLLKGRRSNRARAVLDARLICALLCLKFFFPPFPVLEHSFFVSMSSRLYVGSISVLCGEGFAFDVSLSQYNLFLTCKLNKTDLWDST